MKDPHSSTLFKQLRETMDKDHINEKPISWPLDMAILIGSVIVLACFIAACLYWPFVAP